MDPKLYADKPWGRKKTLSLFVDRMEDIILDIYNGRTLNQVFKKHGKGIDFDTFVFLIKDKLYL